MKLPKTLLVLIYFLFFYSKLISFAKNKEYVSPPSNPTITSFMPSNGLVGSTISIIGTGFINLKSVMLGANPAIFIVISDTQLTLVVPQGSIISKIRLTNQSGTVLSNSFFTVNRSIINSVSNLKTRIFIANIQQGYDSTPIFTDLDKDGLLDLLIGEYIGLITHFEQNAINSTEFTRVPGYFSGIDVDNYSAPTITDLDGDGLLDLLVGEIFGKLYHYEQNSANSSSFTLISNNFNGIDVGFDSTPTFTDLDGDGLLDLIVGEYDGYINYYEQNSANSTVFSLVTQNFNSIDVGIDSTPTFTDLDGDGLLDFIVGEKDGNINHYEQSSTNSLTFTLINDNFDNIKSPSGHSAPTFTDLDGDGLLDLLIGEDTRYALYHYELGILPTISTFSPTCANTGTTVTIRGRNFTGALSLKFGEVDAQSFIVENDTTIKAVVNEGSTGYVSVTTPSGKVNLGTFIFNCVSYWDGGGDNSWEDSTHWQWNALPNVNSNVIIYPSFRDGIQKIPNVNTNVNCKSLFLGINATIEVNGNGIVNIKGGN